MVQTVLIVLLKCSAYQTAQQSPEIMQRPVHGIQDIDKYKKIVHTAAL